MKMVKETTVITLTLKRNLVTNRCSQTAIQVSIMKQTAEAMRKAPTV